MLVQVDCCIGAVADYPVAWQPARNHVQDFLPWIADVTLNEQTTKVFLDIWK